MGLPQHDVAACRSGHSMTGGSDDGKDRRSEDGPTRARTSRMVRRRSRSCRWGDAGLYLSIPNPGLGGAAVAAAGTPEQKERFLARFKGGKPKWARDGDHRAAAAARTRAAIQTTAVRDGDHWVLNGTKIFCTSGLMAAEKSERLRRRLGDARPLGGPRRHQAPSSSSRARRACTSPRSRTSSASAPRTRRRSCFEDCRIPLDNILGSAEVPKTSEGFKGVMATFDATRPIVAASAHRRRPRGARLRARHARRSTASRSATALPPHKLTALERDFMEMEAQLQAARLLTWRAAWMMDNGHPEQPRGVDGEGEGRPRR